MLIDELRAGVRPEYAEPAARTLVMGILNITPDSFSDGGRFFSPQSAVGQARKLVDDGADIVDVGGESSRPGAEPVSPEAEWARVAPVLEALAGTGACVSIDTCHAGTARRALKLGARIVNDITALGDPEMAGVVASAGCDCVLMHMQGMPQSMQNNPQYDDVVDDICNFFEERLAFAVKAGIGEQRLWLDPGFGFGKTPRHNLEILRRLGEFKKFGRPVLIGTSNKGTIGLVTGRPVEDRLEGTAATVAVAIANGADCVRVHDVRAMARVAQMADAIIYPPQV